MNVLADYDEICYYFHVTLYEFYCMYMFNLCFLVVRHLQV